MQWSARMSGAVAIPMGNSAIAHLAPLLDYVDMDGTLLLDEDLANGLTFDRRRTVYTNKAGLGFETTF